MSPLVDFVAEYMSLSLWLQYLSFFWPELVAATISAPSTLKGVSPQLTLQRIVCSRRSASLEIQNHINSRAHMSPPQPARWDAFPPTTVWHRIRFYRPPATAAHHTAPTPPTTVAEQTVQRLPTTVWHHTVLSPPTTV
jgi:hypothetical protein